MNFNKIQELMKITFLDRRKDILSGSLEIVSKYPQILAYEGRLITQDLVKMDISRGDISRLDFYDFTNEFKSDTVFIEDFDFRRILTILKALPNRGCKRTYYQIDTKEWNSEEASVGASVKILIEWLSIRRDSINIYKIYRKMKEMVKPVILQTITWIIFLILL